MNDKCFFCPDDAEHRVERYAFPVRIGANNIFAPARYGRWVCGYHAVMSWQNQGRKSVE